MLAIIKYMLLFIIGAVVFITVHSLRDTAAIGGEVLFIFLPVFWWVTGAIIQDAAHFVKGWKAERTQK